MFDLACRSNSVSTRASSPAIKLKIRRADIRGSSIAAVKLDVFILTMRARTLHGGPILLPVSVRAVIRELHIDSEILSFQLADYVLQGVPVFTAHSHDVALDSGLHLHLCILYELDDLFRLVLRNPLLNRNA